MKTNLKVLLLIALVALTHQVVANQSDERDQGLPESLAVIEISSVQHARLGLISEKVEQVEGYPSPGYIAKAMVPLNKTLSLSLPFAGKVSQIKIVHGDVQAGDFILAIQSEAVIEKQRALIETQALFSAAESDWKRALKLSKSGASSVKNLNSLQAEVTRLSARISMLKNTLKIWGMTPSIINQVMKEQKIITDELALLAPVDGFLHDLNVALNDVTAKGQPLVQLEQLADIVFKLKVPVTQARKLTERQKVKFSNDDAFGEILHIDRMVDEMTQSVEIHASVPVSAKWLPGEMTQAAFVFNRNAYAVSSQALIQLEGERVVFVETDLGVKPLSIKVLSIVDGILYFAPKEQGVQFDSVIIQGSAALKSVYMMQQENSESSSE